MSYILDALQRAQAERGRGSVPGLHTPATPVAGAQAAKAKPAGAVATRWLIALILALGLAGGGWWLWRLQSAPATPVAIAPKPAASAPVAALAPPVPVLPDAPEAAPPSPPVPAAAPQPRAPAPAAATAKPAPPPRQERAAARTPPPPALAERQPGTPPAAAQQAPVKAPTKAPPAATEATAPVFAQADLPPAVREQLPTLQLAGVTYSSNPLYRMVIVNGQVLHEGDQAAPGLVLERIEPGRTVWAFRGYRYALPAQ
ncbi:MAG: general secretion pathway protein GspB [Proteobacteria bacterium]|nr:general secretion pathway protein GspB [Pseudomonadota bacterium]